MSDPIKPEDDVNNDGIVDGSPDSIKKLATDVANTVSTSALNIATSLGALFSHIAKQIEQTVKPKAEAPVEDAPAATPEAPVTTVPVANTTPDAPVEPSPEAEKDPEDTDNDGIVDGTPQELGKYIKGGLDSLKDGVDAIFGDERDAKVKKK